LDAGTTLLGSLLAAAGVLGAAAERLQTERDRLERQVAERDSRIDELTSLHTADQSEIARLRIDIHRLGGTS
jgi:uncharacterized coiled-coil protein SlyX